MSQLTLPIDTLRKIPLFANLNDTECRQVAEIARHREFQPGELVVRHGETFQNLWVLLSGRCEVVKPLGDDRDNDGANGGEQLALAVLEPHSIFGEMSFFHRAPHSASVRAQTHVELLCIPRGDYDDLIRDGAWGAYKLAFNAVASLAERLRRMDDWVADLSRPRPRVAPLPAPPSNEWSSFRDRLFASWNL